ncbi:MAG: hypothetical protein J6I76_14300 [Oribacterium sp.]|nr:hypothetical protein [Oribacterium sp.]
MTKIEELFILKTPVFHLRKKCINPWKNLCFYAILKAKEGSGDMRRGK